MSSAARQQRVDEETLRGLEPCEFLRSSLYTPVIDEDPAVGAADFGTTCTWEDDNGVLRELVTDGSGGLDDLPRQVRDGQTVTRRFGDYSARQEQNDRRCVIAVETGDGQVVAVDYTASRPSDTVCQSASAKLASAISIHIWGT